MYLHPFSPTSNPMFAILLNLVPEHPKGRIHPCLARVTLPVAINHPFPERDASQVPHRRQHFSLSHNAHGFGRQELVRASFPGDGLFYCLCICSLLFFGGELWIVEE